MAERNLEQELKDVQNQLDSLKADYAELVQALNRLREVVEKKMPHDPFDNFVHNDIRMMADKARTR